MLSAFTARPIVEFKARDKSKIESLVASGDRLLVGLNTGVLRIYRVNELAAASSEPQKTKAPDPKTAKEPTHLLREIERFAPRSIDQLAVIKEANTLVSLANYAVSLHDLHSFAPLPGAAPLPGTKNASSFAVTSNIVKDPATNIPEIVSRLAVAVKRRLLLWSWYASELSNHDDASDVSSSEIVLSETIRSLTWTSATKLVVGMNAGYVLVDVLTRTVEEITGGGAVANGNGNGSGNGNESMAGRFGALSGAGMGYMGLGSYMPKPMAAKLGEGEVLLAKDVHTLFIDAETGRPRVSDKKKNRSIPWPTAPESIGYSYPYILSLQPPAKGSLEVRNPATLSLLQTIALPNAAQLHVPPPSVSLAHAGKGFHVSSERGVWKMDATSYDDQIQSLVAAGFLDEAISLIGLLEDALLQNKTETLRSVKILKAEKLFRAKKYLASMDLFNEEDVHAPPEVVLRFFPRSIVGDLSDESPVEEVEETEEEEGDNDKASKNGSKTGASKSNGTEDGTETGTASTAPTNGHDTGDKNGENGDKKNSPPIPQESTSSLAGGFGFWGTRKVNPETASIASKPQDESAAGTTDDAAQAKAEPAEPVPVANAKGYIPLEGKNLTSAVEALNSYLAGTRARLQRVIDPATGKLKASKKKKVVDSEEDLGHQETQETETDDDEDDDAREARLRATFTLVDTTMFRVLMLIRPKLASSLFRIPNFCDPNVVNERLLEHSRYNELVDFFYGKRLHRPALELLKRFGDVDTADKDESAESAESEDKIAPELRGPRRTIAYLKSLGPDDIDLIVEFAAWTLRADPVNGMEVFLADSENAETLPRERVVQFLAGIDARLEMQYLEHVITELNDLTPDFHNRLIEQTIKLLKEGRAEAEVEAASEEETEDSSESKVWSPSMPRLVQFLKESRQYSLSRAFALIPRDDSLFYEAQAVVLSNMGQHKQALEIYVFKMQDYDKAEEYCNRIHQLGVPDTGGRTQRASIDDSALVKEKDGDDDTTLSIYHTLLSLYLGPPAPYQARKPELLLPALDLLSRHGARLPASSTLQLIPDALPAADLASYFRGRMRSANSVVNQSRIERGLRQTQVFAAQAALLGESGRGRRVVVSEERVCGVCHKRLGGSVVSVLPDNSVVHYGCLNRAKRW